MALPLALILKNPHPSTDDMGCISIARNLLTAETCSLYLGLKVDNGWDHVIFDCIVSCFSGIFFSSRYWAYNGSEDVKTSSSYSQSMHGISHLHKQQITVFLWFFNLLASHNWSASRQCFCFSCWKRSMPSFNWSCAHAWHMGVNWMHVQHITISLDSIDIIMLSW